MLNARKLKVAALVDLIRSPQSGGHVKGWERLALAAANSALPLELTVFFSGSAQSEALAPHVTLQQLPQVFSTARLKFLPYLPDHTDLARYHPALATALSGFDVVHTTDAYFAFTRTAERLCQQRQLGLTHSFHTDQPNYARIFTRKAIRETLGDGALSRLLLAKWQVPERAARRMELRRDRHLFQCDLVLATRPSDQMRAEQILGPHGVRHLRLGADKTLFNPQRANRRAICARYAIPADRLIVVFVGRLDEGKNIHTLLDALQRLTSEGLPLHLVAAGIGPAAADIGRLLPHHSTVPGFILPAELATLYASADALALVSEVEIRSMAMVEGLACGLPVLVAEKSGLHQLFPATDAIQTVTGGAAAWSTALRDFATTTLRQRMQTAAQSYALQNIASWEQVLAEDLLPAWQQAATMNHARP
ncbi:MAG: glycosyltransferase [Alphaproteobacteria bacterium]|nr:glycosyltransferase [Alphaproteobacteria bacterium]